MIDFDPAALLADAGQAGAYYVDVRDRAALADAARAQGFHVAGVDLHGVEDRAGLFDAFADALGFPDTFGANWDALADSLGDLSWLPAPGHVVFLDHCIGLREAAPDQFATLLDILDEAAALRARHGLPFWALLPVRAPDL